MIFNMRPLSALVVVACMLGTSSAGIVYRPARNELAANPLFSRQSQVKDSHDTPKFTYGTPDPNYPGVVATGPNGPTNPNKPTLNTPVNQSSEARLATINSVDDWCTFGPMDNSEPLGNVEDRTVAYCTKPRNNARVIPDGTVTSAHFVRTPLYVQVMAFGDFTKINFQHGDMGGELDPHGATNKGNPIGGNVTSNVTGTDVFYEEWMNYISYEMLCFRVCIAGNDQIPAAVECEHELDEMGCRIIMPGNYDNQGFDECDADAAYPPGIYVSNGQTSTFRQYNTGVWTDDKGKTHGYTNGDPDQSTPSLAMTIPSSSNCRTVSSISNGIASLTSVSSSESSSASSGAAAGGAAASSSNGAQASSSSGSSRSGGGSTGSSSAGNAISSTLSSFVAVFAALVAGAALL
ncbi:hypothetical protein MCUN1_000653 [Malassezia cuniculi]|uniref:Uncharacterized protein n=1 Tax=Malassezia cuniculi TaxID=948313 RepID=A0AAF0EW97_9BASI|nr:hypothetical protein MCUN1_000653 [Malassezia cuniculi]